MLKHIFIDNFKSFDHFDMNIPQFAVIVGNNGVGKSNLLKAIKLISLLAAQKSIKDAFIELELVNNELFHDATNPKFTITLEFNVNGVDIKYLLEITQINEPSGNFNFIVSKEVLENSKQIIYREGDKIIINTEEGIPQSNVQLVNSQIALSVIAQPKIVVETQRYLSRMKIDIFDVSKLRNPGSMSNIGPGLNKNLTESLYSLKTTGPNNYSEIEREAKELIMGLENLSVEDQAGNLFITFKEISHNNPLSVFSTSDGNLRLIGILTSILGDPKPSVVIIDELENSMHPKRIRALMKFLNYLSDKESGGTQFIFTTHSPIILKFVQEKDIMYMFKDNGKTQISKPVNNKKIYEHLAKAKDKDLDLGDLFLTGTLEDIYKLGINKTE